MITRFLLFVLLTPLAVIAQNQNIPDILPMRERAVVIDSWLEERMETVLPDLMRQTGIDMWLIISREYNEDPVIKTFLPSTWHAARRTTMLLIYDPGEDKKLESFAMARYNVGNIFQKAWNKAIQPDQWKALSRIIQEKNPKKIGVNKSETYALADGISATEYELLMDNLPGDFQKRVVSAEDLAVGWLETRSESEMASYQHIVRIAHEVIKEGFSDKVITPGITTTDDVVWWFRERIRELKLQTWFHTSVSIQRGDNESFEHLRAFSERPQDQVIYPGDLLHVDFGITYLRLNTDTQQHAYILKPGETDAPEYLKKALANSNRVQDILIENIELGRTGNEILAGALAQCKTEGLKGVIYTHPIGFHGHAAGTTIGMWDMQDGVPGTGDHKMAYKTAYSIELNSSTYVEEWKKDVRVMLEEDGYYDETGFRYIDGRQKDFILIGKHLKHNGN
ncbi:MAG: M24 family metallopeptidase [Cyclobacteriaceae bacterium]